MRKILISLYDCKSETWTDPAMADSKASAIRMFGGLVNDPDRRSLVSQHPADFDLFLVGRWERLDDEQRPRLISCDFEHLANGIDVRAEEPIHG